MSTPNERRNERNRQAQALRDAQLVLSTRRDLESAMGHMAARPLELEAGLELEAAILKLRTLAFKRALGRLAPTPRTLADVRTAGAPTAPVSTLEVEEAC